MFQNEVGLMTNERKQERIEKFNRHKKKKEHTKFAEGKFKAPKKRSKYKLNINDINNIEEH